MTKLASGLGVKSPAWPGDLAAVLALPGDDPFAFGWFFTLPLILIRESGVIGPPPMIAQAVIVFAFFIALQLYGGDRLASSNLYLYRWPEQWKIGGMPWLVAVRAR